LQGDDASRDQGVAQLVRVRFGKRTLAGFEELQTLRLQMAPPGELFRAPPQEPPGRPGLAGRKGPTGSPTQKDAALGIQPG
jgi:hypothetical protein